MGDFHSMSRRELQALCKKHGIPANSTNSQLADRLAALFSKAQEGLKPPGPSCLKGSGGGGGSGSGGDGHGANTRSKDKRVTFMLPERSIPVLKTSTEPAAASPVARTTRSRALRPQGDAGAVIPLSDARSSRRGREAKALGHRDVDGGGANAGEEDSSDCVVDEGMVAGGRSLRSRVVVAAVDGGTRRSLKRRDRSVTEDMGTAGKTASDELPTPVVPVNSKVGGRRESRKRHQDPVLDVETTQKSAPVADTVAQTEAEKEGPRRSKRNLQNHENAVPGRKMAVVGMSKEGALEISAPGGQTGTTTEVAVGSDDARAEISKRPRRSQRNPAKFGNEEQQGHDQGDAVKNKLQKKVQNSTSERADGETFASVGNKNCSAAPEIEKKPQKITQGEEQLRRSKRNALNRDQLLNDISTSTGKLGDGDENVARAISRRKPKMQTGKRGAAFDRENEKIIGCLEVEEKHVAVSDFAEPSKRKRRKSTKYDVTEQEVSLPPLGKPEENNNNTKNESCGETDIKGFGRKSPETIPSCDEANNGTKVLENVEEPTELLHYEEPPKELKDGRSKDASIPTKQEKTLDAIVEKNNSEMCPREPNLETDASLRKSKTGSEHFKLMLRQEENSPKEVQKRSELQNFEEDCQVSDIGTPAADGLSMSSDKSQALVDEAQIGSMTGPGSIIQEIIEFSPMNRKESGRKTSHRKVTSSSRRSGKKKAADGYQCLEESNSPTEEPLCAKSTEYVIDNADVKTFTGFSDVPMHVESLPMSTGEGAIVARVTDSLEVEVESESSQSCSPPRFSAKDETVISLMDDELNKRGFSSNDQAKCCGAVEGIVTNVEKQIPSMSMDDNGRVVGASLGLMDQLPNVADSEASDGAIYKHKVNEDIKALEVSTSRPEVSPVGYSESELTSGIMGDPGQTNVSSNVLKAHSSPHIHDQADSNPTLEIPYVGDDETLSPLDIVEDGRRTEAAKSPSDFHSGFCSHSRPYGLRANDQGPSNMLTGSESHKVSASTVLVKSRNKKVPSEAVAATLLRTHSLEAESETPGSEKKCKSPVSDRMQDSSYRPHGEFYDLTADDPGSESHEVSVSSLLMKNVNEKVPGEAVAATLLRTQSLERECKSSGSDRFGHNDQVNSAKADGPSDTHAISTISTIGLDLTCEDAAAKENFEVHFDSNSIGQNLTYNSASEKSAEPLEVAVARKTNEESSLGLRINSRSEVVASLSASTSISKAFNPDCLRHHVAVDEDDAYSQSQLLAEDTTDPKNQLGRIFTDMEDQYDLEETSEILTGDQSAIKFSDTICCTPEKKLSLNEHEQTTEAISHVLDAVMLVNESAERLKTKDIEVAAGSIGSRESDLNNRIELVKAVADTFDGVLENKVSEQSESMEVQDKVASDCALNFLGHKETTVSNIGHFDREIELSYEEHLAVQGADDVTQVSPTVKTPESGQYSPAMSLHAPVCEEGFEDKQLTDRFTELLDVEVGCQASKDLSSYKGMINSELHTGISYASVSSPSIYHPICEANNSTKNRCLVDLNDDDINDETQHELPYSAAEEFVEEKSCPTDFEVDMPIDKDGRHVLHETGKLLTGDQSKEFSANSEYDPSNVEETGLLDPGESVETLSCEVQLVKHEMTAELIEDAWDNEKKLGNEVAQGMENTVAEDESGYQSTLDLEEMGTTGIRLDNFHLFNPANILKLQDSAEADWKGLETTDKPVEGTDSADHCTMKVDGSSLQDNKPLYDQSFILSIESSDGGNMNLHVKLPESSCVEIKTDVGEVLAPQACFSPNNRHNDGCLEFNHRKLVSLVKDVNSVEILDSSIQKLYPDSLGKESGLSVKEDIIEHDLSYETYAEGLQTENTTSGFDCVDHGETEKEENEPDRQASVQMLSFKQKSQKEKEKDMDNELEEGVPKESETMITNIDELRGVTLEKKSSYEYEITVYDAVNSMDENDYQGHTEFEQEENTPNSGPSEEKLDHEAEYRCQHGQNEITGENKLAFIEPARLVNESQGGNFDRSLHYESMSGVEEEYVDMIFAEQLEHNKCGQTSSNKRDSISDHDYFVHVDDLAFQSLVHDIQSTILVETGNEATIEQVQGSQGSEDTAKDSSLEAGATWEEAVEIRTKSQIQEQREAFNYLIGSDHPCHQDSKHEPECTMTECEEMESLNSVEGHHLEKPLDLEATEHAASLKRQEKYLGQESDDYSTFGHCTIDKQDRVRSTSKLTELGSRRNQGKGDDESCRNNQNLHFTLEGCSEDALRNSLKDVALVKTSDDSQANAKGEVEIVATDKNEFSKRDSTMGGFCASDSSSCQDTVGRQAGEEEISHIFNDMHISSANKQMIIDRISCSPRRNQSLRDLLQLENMKENTPYSKMLHATNITVDKSTIPTSKRRALADLQNKAQRE